MAKQVQWGRIIDTRGVKIRKEVTVWGFVLSVEKSCHRQEVKDMAEKLRAKGYDAHYDWHRKYPGPNAAGAIIKVYSAEYAVAAGKLTPKELKLIKAAASHI